MPELPEVETTRRGIEPALLGQTVTGWTIRDPRLRWPVQIPQQLANCEIEAVSRRAKYLLLKFAPGTLILHLGMSGSLRILPVATPALKHDHVDLHIGADRILRLNDPRRFGCVLYPASSPVTGSRWPHRVIQLTETYSRPWGSSRLATSLMVTTCTASLATERLQ